MLYRVTAGLLLFVALLLATLLGTERGASAAPDGEGSLIALSQGLSLEVTETGPDQLWTLHLSNLGEFPIGLVADPGLLWFQVDVPGHGAPHTCRLPEPLWPKTMRRRAQMVLAPGERFSRRFDPRFFCFADLVQTVLVPGARVTPRFGWPLETRTTKAKSKRPSAPLPPAAPFVAWVMEDEETTAQPSPGSEPFEAEIPEGAAEDAGGDAPWTPPTEGLKHVVGAAFVLSPAYAKWSQPAPTLPPGMHALTLAGSDAEDERNVTATVGLVNTSNISQEIFVRRELISFYVIGPDGTFVCPTGDLGPPDVASFSTLAPRGAERLVIRLIEMCPRGRFSRPGLYEVHATVEAKYSGLSAGLEAFVGTLTAPRPALVRVRSGDRSSFLRAAPIMAAAGGAPRAANGTEAEAPAPADGAQEAPPAEEMPPDHDAPAVPEEAPASEQPAEGTTVE